jgi:ubiquinone/menaquinone biosynthesis C-methylase UbiE
MSATLLKLLSLINRQRYWDTIAGKFSQEEWQNQIFPQHHWLKKIVIQEKPRDILEIGCGFGRNIKFLSKETPNIKLFGADFSFKMLQIAHKDLPKMPLVTADILKLPFIDNSVDFIFTHGVLMHTPPDKTINALQELLRITKKHLLIIEEIRSQPGKINTHTWAHNYPDLFSKVNVKIKKIKYDNHDLIWIYGIKEDLTGRT